MADCRSCGAPLRAGARFCSDCGTAQAASRCTGCGAELEAGARFCSECGTPTSAAPGEAATGAAAGAEVSRRVTSVLFGDLVGFTTLSEDRDQEEVRDLLSRYFEECRTVVGRYGGTIEKFIGDAVMAIWGVPVAHEDDAERSVRAGLELVSAVAALREEVGVPTLDLRVGIVTGEVAVTVGATQQGMVAGDPVNTAARVQGVAAPGQVWVDETTRLLSSSAITFVDAGSHRLKGKADPVPLWSVRAVVAAVGGAQRADGLEAPLVGRDRELRLVKEMFHRVEESGRQALLLVSGDAGVGKSRLSWEFEKYVDGLRTSTRWHSGRCVSYGEGVAYYALAEAVRGRLEAGRQDEEETLPVLLDRALRTHLADEEERAWVGSRLEVLLGMSSGATHERRDLFSAWTAFFRAVGGPDEPVVLVVEDAQHADEGLLAFLIELLDGPPFPCFVLLMARPELVQQRPEVATHRRVTVVHLDELADSAMEHVFDGLVGGLPGEVRSALVARAEGVPLYAVEIVRSLVDRDLVVPRGGQYVLLEPDTLDLEQMGAPASLQALVAARLDTLTPELRTVVCRASAVGTSFALDALAPLCPGVDLDRALGELVHLQILRREDSRLSSEHGLYVFVQSVVRQVAYGTLSRRDRRTTHLAVAASFEEGGRPLELAPVVAEHYLEAVRAVPDDPDNPRLLALAADRLRAAASRALGLGAPAEAAAHLRVALGLLDDPAFEAEVRRDLAMALVRSGRSEEGVEQALAAVAASDALGDEVGGALASAALAEAHTIQLSDPVLGIQTALARYRRLGQHLTGPQADLARLELLAAIGVGSSRLDHDAWAALDPPLAPGEDLDDFLIEAAVLSERVANPRRQIESWHRLALRFQQRGAPALCRALLEQSLVLARASHEPRAVARCLLNVNAIVNGYDVEAATASGREGMALWRTLGEPFFVMLSAANLGVARWCAGDWREVLQLTDPDAVDDKDPTIVFLRAWASRRAGIDFALPDDLPVESGDAQAVLWGRAVESARAAGRGDAEAAVAAALESVRVAETYMDLGDDFFAMWFNALELARAAGATDALRELGVPLSRHPDRTVPTSLEAARHYLGAVLGAEDGARPEVVDQEFRLAVEWADRWGGLHFAALFREDHAQWLQGQGRAEEAEELRKRVRDFEATTGRSPEPTPVQPGH